MRSPVVIARRLLLALAWTTLLAGCAKAPAPPPEFPAFWAEFRQAALAGDWGRLAAMAEFPLEVRGPMDEDPTITVARTAFAETFAEVLDQDSGERAEAETVRQFLERTPTPPEGRVAADRARVGDLEFETVRGRWRLVRVYRAEAD